MPKINPKLAVATAVVLALSACSFDWLPGSYRVLLREGKMPNTKQLDRLRVGMTKRQVRLLLGEPVLRNPFHKHLWYYIRREETSKRRVSEQCLALRFKGEALTHFVEKSREVHIAGDAQPWCGPQAAKVKH